MMGSVITAMDKKFHKQCFTCNECKKELADSTFHVQNAKPFCSGCNKTINAVTCNVSYLKLHNIMAVDGLKMYLYHVLIITDHLL